ncbi:DUF1304 domain-containing protein [Deinococcus sp. HMF7604]|uniref:DUF1304 domain-containing protein n=1 Tax=Deinococcus betulae TaxID=2873312 RepID=UPI001CCB8E89|nr:DUF1304 domain-containing protein [Deinococcus betulae]MBZ9750937.1 DUF1304 domain-containing protein [Deinococcus betulae]
MTLLGNVVVGAVALIHVYILVLEMFLWETPRAMKAFGTTPALAAQTRSLAANQGLYNGFLAAGLLWGLVTDQFSVKVFFLLCVLVAGVYGATSTRNPRIHFVQTVPATLGLLLLWLGR